MRVVDRLIGLAERLAGGFLAFVAALTFVAVVLRYGFSRSVPDSYDFSRLFLGILIFWGIAVTGFRGEHITVDLLWGALSGRWRRVLDLFGSVFTLACMAALAWGLGAKVLDVFGSSEETYDLHLPVWPFTFVAWLGVAASVLMVAVRIMRQLRRPMASDEPASISVSH
jgi:TRAP-type transport system small permease protein